VCRRSQRQNFVAGFFTATSAVMFDVLSDADIKIALQGLKAIACLWLDVGAGSPGALKKNRVDGLGAKTPWKARV
jgi:hypothetical protein